VSDTLFLILLFAACYFVTLATGYEMGWDARGIKEARDARTRQSG
jgi:hypothetical protein